VHIRTARPEQCRVQPLLVVRCHEDNLTFLRADAVQSVKEAGERERLLSLHLISLQEHGVHIFQQDDRILWGLREQPIQRVIVHLAVREVQIAEFQLEQAGYSLHEGGLARAWRPEQQVAPPVGDTFLRVPFGGVLELPDIFS